MPWPLVTVLAAGLALVGGRALAQPGIAPLWLRLQAAVAGGLLVYGLTRSLPRRAGGVSHGSAGFAEAKELADLLVTPDTRLAPGSVLLGTLETNLLALPLDLARQHGVIVGGSGTGKSFSFFLPNAAFAHQTSLVATDPKSELWNRTSGFHHSTRYAPADPEASACLNWIGLCGDARIADLCARALVTAGGETQEPPWQDLEAAFLAALFSYTATLSVPTPLTAYTLLTNTPADTLIAQFLRSASPAAREQAIIFQQTHERMRGSITPVVAAKLAFLRDPALQRFTSASLAPPDFGQLRQRAQALYWCLEEQDMVRLRGVTSLFFTVLLEQLAAERKREQTNIPIVCLLDEFANIGTIPNYAAVISLSRGRGVALWHGIQSLSQLEAAYGKANAQTILANCATKIVLGGADVDTAEYFSRALGPKTEVVPRPSYQRRRFALFASGRSDTVQEHPRPLLTADEIRRMPTQEALVLTGNRRPFRLTKYWYGLSPFCGATSALGPACFLPVRVRERQKDTPRRQAHREDDVPPLPPDLNLLPGKATSPNAEPESGGAGKAQSKNNKKRSARPRAQTTWLKPPPA